MRSLVLATTALLCLGGVSLASAADVTGLWATEPRTSGAYITVRITPCASDRQKRCGRVAGAHGGARPDIVGEKILRGMSPQDDGSWGGGEILRPGKDEAYSSKLRRTDAGLEVQGCVIGGLICRSQIWRLVP